MRTSNGPTLPTILENTGLQEPVKKSCAATVTKGSQLDEDRGQESDRKEEPPDTLGAHLPAPQHEWLKRVWLKLSKHMREIKSKLGGPGWKPKTIRRLGQVLMEYQHRFSKGQEDLGSYKNDPFEIKLKEDAKTPIVSRSYRYNPVVASEVDCRLDNREVPKGRHNKTLAIAIYRSNSRSTKEKWRNSNYLRLSTTK